MYNRYYQYICYSIIFPLSETPCYSLKISVQDRDFDSYSMIRPLNQIRAKKPVLVQLGLLLLVPGERLEGINFQETSFQFGNFSISSIAVATYFSNSSFSA